jgi:CxxC motif-containing protein (DUF1111 family)
MKPSSASRRAVLCLSCLVAAPVLGFLLYSPAVWAADAAADTTAASAEAAVSGEEIFLREWLAGDSRSHGGDGLGPVFNDSSCVACHNQGGTGGGGPASKNVEIVTAVSRGLGATAVRANRSATEEFVRSMLGLVPDGRQALDPKVALQMQQRQREELAKIHPGFRTAGSVVLHRFGTAPEYAAWRQTLAGGTSFQFRGRAVMVPELAVPTVVQAESIPGRTEDREAHVQNLHRAMQQMHQVRNELAGVQFTRTSFVDGTQITLTERNATALFGVGQIDAIPDDAIEAAAEVKHEGFGDISGRVSRLKDGSIGRFGWKAQKKSLHDFTMTACAVELGLNVPEHAQAGTPLDPEYTTVGYDLDQRETAALVDFLGKLPAPRQRQPAGDKEAEYLQAGRTLFASAGCATCHTPDLGEAVGLFSDLLVHDMGADLVDTGEYGSFTPVPDSAEEVVQEVVATADGQEESELRVVGATRQEWRTPPLWGCRDSAPYLHDGRAETLEQAIAFHGGEAALPAQKYFMLSPAERQQLLAFLKSLEAPRAGQLAQR